MSQSTAARTMMQAGGGQPRRLCPHVRYGPQAGRVMLGNDGKELRGADQLIAKGRKRIREAAPYAVRFHLAPGVEATVTADGMGAICDPRALRRGTFAAVAAISRPRKACGSTAVLSPNAPPNLSSSAKCRHWAAKSAGSSAARVNQEGRSMTDLVPVRRAIISLSDKSGLATRCRPCAASSGEIVSTGGTAAAVARERRRGAGH